VGLCHAPFEASRANRKLGGRASPADHNFPFADHTPGAARRLSEARLSGLTTCNTARCGLAGKADLEVLEDFMRPPAFLI